MSSTTEIRTAQEYLFQKIKVPEGPDSVRRAWYGDASQLWVRGIDVTGKVREILECGGDTLGCSNTLFGDPCPGVRKVLAIEIQKPAAEGSNNEVNAEDDTKLKKKKGKRHSVGIEDMYSFDTARIPSEQPDSPKSDSPTKRDLEGQVKRLIKKVAKESKAQEKEKQLEEPDQPEPTPLSSMRFPSPSRSRSPEKRQPVTDARVTCYAEAPQIHRRTEDASCPTALREKAFEDSELVDAHGVFAAPEEQVYLMEKSEDGEWTRIRCATGHGWVRAEYLHPVEPVQTVEPEPRLKVGEKCIHQTEDGEYTMLRMEADEDADFDGGYVKSKEKVQLLQLSEDGVWAQIDCEEGQGWVRVCYMEPCGPDNKEDATAVPEQKEEVPEQKEEVPEAPPSPSPAPRGKREAMSPPSGFNPKAPAFSLDATPMSASPKPKEVFWSLESTPLPTSPEKPIGASTPSLTQPIEAWLAQKSLCTPKKDPDEDLRRVIAASTPGGSLAQPSPAKSLCTPKKDPEEDERSQAYYEAERKMDESLYKCFLQAVKTRIKDRDLPMMGTTFYGKHMRLCRKIGTSCDVKDSSFKWLKEYMLHLEDEGLLVLDPKSTDPRIMQICRNHPDIRAWQPWAFNATEASQRSRR